MPQHLMRDFESLKAHLNFMGKIVEDAITSALSALKNRDDALARQVQAGDDQIDRLEVNLEEECLKVLALHQPVATDLRFVISVLKVNNDLERMGDLAASIAGRAHYLATHEAMEAPGDLMRMQSIVKTMVGESLQSLIQLDTSLANHVLEVDDQVDEIHAAMFSSVEEVGRKKPDCLRRAIHYLSVSRCLERIADLATNIAEDVIFLVNGEVIRHQPEDH